MQLITLRAKTLLAIALFATVCVRGAFASEVAPTVRVGATVVASTLQSKHQRYGLNEPILLRFTIRNATTDGYLFLTRVPWHSFHLAVLDSSGKLVQPPGDVDFHDFRQRVFASLPTESLTLTAPDGDQWVSLANWGYSALPPGTYKITAVPYVVVSPSGDSGPSPRISAFLSAPTPAASSSVTVVVVPG